MIGSRALRRVLAVLLALWALFGPMSRCLPYAPGGQASARGEGDAGSGRPVRQVRHWLEGARGSRQRSAAPGRHQHARQDSGVSKYRQRSARRLQGRSRSIQGGGGRCSGATWPTSTSAWLRWRRCYTSEPDARWFPRSRIPHSLTASV